MTIIVLDTNAIISGLLSTKSPPAKILDLAMQGKFHEPPLIQSQGPEIKYLSQNDITAIYAFDLLL